MYSVVFFNDTAPTEIYPYTTLFPYTALFRSTHCGAADPSIEGNGCLLAASNVLLADHAELIALRCVDAVQANARAVDLYGVAVDDRDRKSTRLNSSH